MFESLTTKLDGIFTQLRGRGKLTESNIKDAMREIRLALLEADVNFQVVKDFVERGLGFGILPYSSITPGLGEGRYKAEPLEGLTITRTLVRRSDRTPTPAVMELTRLVHDEIERMIKAGGFGKTPV